MAEASPSPQLHHIQDAGIQREFENLYTLINQVMERTSPSRLKPDDVVQKFVRRELQTNTFARRWALMAGI